ncbi:MAG: hypothetical protein FH751_14470 [Firmicutes bacterium]|nr:hypothetical protein [Bacillota bacterium]
MFLQELNDIQRKNFLELAVYGMKVNEELHESQKNIINTFRLEMCIEDYVIKNKPIKDIITEFQGSKKSIKKIVLIELFGVLLTDGAFDDKESDLVNLCAKKWNFRDSEIKKMRRWVQDFNDLLVEGYEYIMK